MTTRILSKGHCGRSSLAGSRGRIARLRALLFLSLSVALGAAPAWAARLTRGPYLQMLTTDSITIVWNTDESARCSLAMRPLGGEERIIEGETGKVCAVTADGLAAGTRYAYVPEADGVALRGESIFQTDDRNLQGYTFLVFSDSGTESAGQMTVRDRMLESPADFVFHAGDMSQGDGKASEYDPQFFTPYEELLREVVIWPCHGNHDRRTSSGGPWREAFYTPANNAEGAENYYSFDFGNAHVVILDSNSDTSPGSPQQRFLDEDLGASTAMWKFVAVHHTMYSSGTKHGSDTNLRRDLTPVFDAHGVDIVFMGHDHDYERTAPLRNNQIVEPGEGTVYVTTGGGGGSLNAVGQKWYTAYAESAFHFTRVSVVGGSLLLEMVREDGVVRDSMTLAKGPPPRCGDGLVNKPGERCDGSDDTACPGQCDFDCQCPPFCGDDVVNQPAEECDGTDDAACVAGCGMECVCEGAPLVFDLEPVADTYIEKGAEATWDHGAAEHMDVDKRPRGISYLKFNLSGLAEPVRTATLRLYSVNASDDGGTIYPVADSSWLEGIGNGVDSSSAGGPGLKWIDVDTNEDGILDALDDSPYVPDFTQPVVSLGGVSKGQTLEPDVTAAFQEGPGMYTLAISGESSDGVTYSSRERLAVEKRPVLTLELESVGSCSSDGERCADGDLCTWPDRCQGGVCLAGNPVSCAARDDCHDTGVCDPASGRCSYPPRKDGTPCDDESLCTEGDVCVAGVCTGESRVICPAPGQCDQAVACDPSTGECPSPLTMKNGTPCDDGNACTLRDMCIAGVCAGADPVICTALEECHDAGVCDPITGLCSAPQEAPAGTPCDDGNGCTKRDTCTRGVCVGAEPVVCVPLDDCHAAGVCDPATGLCSISEKSDEVRLTFEAEADAHTNSDQPGTNFEGSPSLHLDGRPEQHVYLRFNVSGIEGLPIKSAIVRLGTTEAVNAGSLHGGSIHTVSDGTWDESALTHANRPPIDGPALASVGEAIDPSQNVDYDVTAAIIGDGTYNFGIVAGSNNMAIFSSREAATGRPTLIVSAERLCDDGNACTQIDTCVAGGCVGRNPLTCPPPDECHDAGVCDLATGACSYPPRADGAPCGDSSPCIGARVCVNGVCESSAPVDCDDGVGCTEDLCDAVTGACLHVPQDLACDSGVYCDGMEYCDVEIGCVVEPVDCDDFIPCTVDWCDEELRECAHVPDHASCDDGNLCTIDTCDPAAGCEYRESGLCEPIVLDVEAVADTYIEKGAEATWDHGAAGHLDADTRPRGIMYLKFDLSFLTAPVQAATLRLYCMNASDDGGTVYPVGDSSWEEGNGNGIDGSSAGGPGLKWIDVDTNEDGAVDVGDGSPYVPDFTRPLASLGPASRGQILEADVTAAVEGGAGIYTLAITNGSSDGVTYWSRERSSADRRPSLQIEIAPSGP